MRQLAGTLNRGWLAVIGIVALLIGLAGVLVSTGLLSSLTGSTGAGVPSGPAANGSVIPSGAGRVFAASSVAVAVAAFGVIVGLLGLLWLLAQLPRANRARPLRLHDEATSGLTVCDPQVLSRAVEDDLNALAGVRSADAVLRGTAKAPELTVRVSADDRTDLAELVRSVRADVADHLAQAMDTPLAHLGVQVDIERGKRTSGSVTV